MPIAAPVPDGCQLFVKSDCGHSRKALLTLNNLHLDGSITIRNAAAGLIERMDTLDIGQTGTFWHQEGYALPW